MYFWMKLCWYLGCLLKVIQSGRGWEQREGTWGEVQMKQDWAGVNIVEAG